MPPASTRSSIWHTKMPTEPKQADVSRPCECGCKQDTPTPWTLRSPRLLSAPQVGGNILHWVRCKNRELVERFIVGATQRFRLSLFESVPVSSLKGISVIMRWVLGCSTMSDHWESLDAKQSSYHIIPPLMMCLLMEVAGRNCNVWLFADDDGLYLDELTVFLYEWQTGFSSDAALFVKRSWCSKHHWTHVDVKLFFSQVVHRAAVWVFWFLHVQSFISLAKSYSDFKIISDKVTWLFLRVLFFWCFVKKMWIFYIQAGESFYSLCLLFSPQNNQQQTALDRCKSPH